MGHKGSIENNSDQRSIGRPRIARPRLILSLLDLPVPRTPNSDFEINRGISSEVRKSKNGS